MSTRFESASSERATRSSFPTNTALTVGLHGYLHSLPSVGNFTPLVSMYGNFKGFWVAVNSSGNIVIHDYNSGNNYTGSTVLSTLTWFYVWFRMASASAVGTAYLNGSTTAEIASVASIAIDEASMTLQFASNQAGFDTDWHGDLSLSSAKLWSIDRAASNANTEKASMSLVSSTSALAEYRFLGTDITDYFSGARHLTATGTLSAGPDSPVDGAAATKAPPLFHLLRPRFVPGRRRYVRL